MRPSSRMDQSPVWKLALITLSATAAADARCCRHASRGQNSPAARWLRMKIRAAARLVLRLELDAVVLDLIRPDERALEAERRAVALELNRHRIGQRIDSSSVTPPKIWGGWRGRDGGGRIMSGLGVRAPFKQLRSRVGAEPCDQIG